MGYKDLRGWIDEVEKLGQLKHIDGADWQMEIGSITEIVCKENKRRPAILFDNIKGYPPGYRVLSGILGTMARIALTTNMDMGIGRLDFVKEWKGKLRNIPLIPPVEVSRGPVMENVMTGAEVDLFKFPTPKWHELDGGRYLGTGCLTITKDPESGWVNLGTYRVMIRDKNTLCALINTGKHASIHQQKYFASNKPCPIAISVGQDPLLFLVAGSYMAPGVCEYDIAGAIRGEPIEVIRGEATGLPLPAFAEIVIEGESLPGVDGAEGPFGEFTGYYGSGENPVPLIKVKRVLYRNNPIITGAPPSRPPNETSLFVSLCNAANVWENMEKAGVPDIQGVFREEVGQMNFTVVSIKQRYPGHARQAGLLASQVQGGAFMGKYVVVVDDDIDPSNFNEVLWALCNRVDPESSCQIIRRCWSGPLEVAARPGQKGFNSQLIIDACKPYEWMAEFPPEVKTSPELREQVFQTFGKEMILD
ncbi:MAG: UbiD family decarboxylase [Dehalococcoidia bacterium]|nr:UbiD family decarboxylase [Dehalococcoidia bacterium]